MKGIGLFLGVVLIYLGKENGRENILNVKK